MHHIHQNPKKNQIEQKTQESLKNESVASETGGQLEKKNRNTEWSFINRRHNENLVNLWGETEEWIRYKTDPKGNVVNLTAFSFSKNEYKLY